MPESLIALCQQGSECTDEEGLTGTATQTCPQCGLPVCVSCATVHHCNRTTQPDTR